MADKKNLSFKKIKKIYHEQVKVEQPVVEVKVEPQVVLPEPVSIVEEKPVEPPRVEIIKGTENLVNEFLSIFGTQDLVELVPTTKAPTPKTHIPASAFVNPSDLDSFLKNIQEAEDIASITEQAPEPIQVSTSITKQTLDLTKPKVSGKNKIDPNIKLINDRLNVFEKRLSNLAMIPGQDPGGGETKLRGLDDIDKSSIGAGKFLSYDETTSKFTFLPISGTNGVSQVQSNWTQSNTSALDYIKNKPTLFSGSYNDLIDKPTIPIVPTTLSSFTNDAGYLTSISWNDLTDKPTIPTVPTNVSAFTNDANYVVSSALASFVNVAAFNTTLGDYASKSYVTAQGYATQTYVDGRFTNLIGVAPAALDTLKEIADQLAADESIVSSLTTTVAGKVSLTGSYADPSWITSLAYSKLTGTPTIPTVPTTVSSFTNDAGYLTSVNWAQITGKPVNISYFTNDAGYLTSVGWAQVTDKPANILTLNDIGVVSNDMLVNKSITIGSTAVELGTSITTLTGLTGVTSNAATAFIAGTAAESGVALQMPREGALRNMTNGFNNMYFDVSNGGSAHGAFQFRSSNGFTNVLNMSPTAVTFNSGATVTAQTAAVGRTSFNVALDTVVTVDNLKYRISNQGGVFPQIASASGSQVDVCYDVLGVVNGTTNPTYANNSGYLLAANGTWLSIYSSHGMDSRSDRLTAHITDKAAGKIYRVTFMKTNNSSNTDGYNIIVERII